MTPPSTASQSDETHLYWLDWLRFVAALMVVAIHSRGANWVEWARLAECSRTTPVAAFFALTRAGDIWVLVFFVLSGFLVGGKVIERLANGTFNFRSYIIDRFSRIWTPLVPALCWSAIVAYWVGKPLYSLDFCGNLLGLQGVCCQNLGANMPLWSLGFEIWFYFLAGSVAIWMMADTCGKIVAILAMALGFAVFTKLSFVYLSAWILGASTYFLCKRPRLPVLAAAGTLLVAAGYVFSNLKAASVSVDTSYWAQFTPSNECTILILSTGLALLVPFMTQLKPKSRLGDWINEFGGKLAAFSYTLYLTHYPLLYIWEYYQPERHHAIDGMSITWFSLRVLSCVAFGWLCYLPFEKQTGRLRKWLRSNWSTMQAS